MNQNLSVSPCTQRALYGWHLYRFTLARIIRTRLVYRRRAQYVSFPSFNFPFFFGEILREPNKWVLIQPRAINPNFWNV